MRSVLIERRGLVGVAKSAWSMRRAVGDLRDVAGGALPSLVALSPAYLLLTAAAGLVGPAVVVAAFGVLLLRLLL